MVSGGDAMRTGRYLSRVEVMEKFCMPSKRLRETEKIAIAIERAARNLAVSAVIRCTPHCHPLGITTAGAGTRALPKRNGRKT